MPRYVRAGWARMDEAAEEIVVEERVDIDGAVDRTLDRVMIEAFPARAPDDLLRALPGLHPSSHGGQGKAYQIFLRGFDAEHGTAVAVDVEGIPLNEVNNVHGHGYLDLHVLPDRLMRTVVLHAGVPRGEDGDFAVAGAATYRLGLERGGLYGALGGGTDRSGRLELAWRPDDAPTGTFAVAEVDAGLGAAPQRAWRQANVGLGLERRMARGSARAWLLAYDGRFESPGALREDDLDALGLYGAYEEAGGGHSQRLLGQIAGEHRLEATDLQAMAWGGARSLVLDQNFTGYLFDPVAGDATRQTLGTLQGGGEARARHAVGTGPRPTVFDLGVEGRHDLTDATFRDLPVDGPPGPARDGTAAHQTGLGGWLEALVAPHATLALEATARVDHFELVTDEATARATLPSPRGRLRWSPVAPLELTVAAGRALQSPEARAVIDGARAPVTVADAVEAGLGLHPHRRWHVRTAAFRTDLDDELVFDHTVARYVAGGSTRRWGATGVLEAQPVDAVRLTSDVTFADARFTATGTPVPFAPRWLTVHGLYLTQRELGPALWTGGLRVWTLGRRPLPDGFVSRSAVAADLTLAAEVGRTRLGLEVDNVLGNRWRDGEFVYPSRWDLDAPPSERAALHVTAGRPFAARVSIGHRFR